MRSFIPKPSDLKAFATKAFRPTAFGRAAFAAAPLALVLGVTAAGCKDDKAPPPAPAAGTPAAPTATAPAAAAKVGDHHEGPKHELGSAPAGGYLVSAVQFGSVAPGKEVVFMLGVGGGTGKPTAVRAWVGTAAGDGSAKAKAAAEGDDYDVHVELPATLPPDSKLWVELETPAGKPTASFATKA